MVAIYQASSRFGSTRPKWITSGVQFTVVQLIKTHTADSPRRDHYLILAENTVWSVAALYLYIDKTMDQTAALGFPKPVFATMYVLGNP